MGGSFTEVIGLLTAVTTVALIIGLVARGGKTAQVIAAAGNVFTKSLSIATGQ